MIVWENTRWCIESDDKAVYVTNAFSAATVKIVWGDWQPLKFLRGKFRRPVPDNRVIWQNIPKTIKLRAERVLKKLPS